MKNIKSTFDVNKTYQIEAYFDTKDNTLCELINQNDCAFEIFFDIETNKKLNEALLSGTFLEALQKDEKRLLSILRQYLNQLEDLGTISYQKEKGLYSNFVNDPSKKAVKKFAKCIGWVTIESIYDSEGNEYLNANIEEVSTLSPTKSLAYEVQIVKKAMDILFNDENRKYWAVKNPNLITDIGYWAEELTHSYEWDKDGVMRSALNKSNGVTNNSQIA